MSVTEEEKAARELRRKREVKVQVFTLVMGLVVALGALAGLFVGLSLSGAIGFGNNPLLPIVFSLLGLALTLVLAYRLTKRLLIRWLA